MVAPGADLRASAQAISAPVMISHWSPRGRGPPPGNPRDRRVSATLYGARTRALLHAFFIDRPDLAAVVIVAGIILAGGIIAGHAAADQASIPEVKTPPDDHGQSSAIIYRRELPTVAFLQKRVGTPLEGKRRFFK